MRSSEFFIPLDMISGFKFFHHRLPRFISLASSVINDASAVETSMETSREPIGNVPYRICRSYCKNVDLANYTFICFDF